MITKRRIKGRVHLFLLPGESREPCSSSWAAAHQAAQARRRSSACYRVRSGVTRRFPPHIRGSSKCIFPTARLAPLLPPALASQCRKGYWESCQDAEPCGPSARGRLAAPGVPVLWPWARPRVSVSRLGGDTTRTAPHGTTAPGVLCVAGNFTEAGGRWRLLSPVGEVAEVSLRQAGSGPFSCFRLHSCLLFTLLCPLPRRP